MSHRLAGRTPLTTFKVTPATGVQRVALEPLRNLFDKSVSPDALDLGGSRIYSSSHCMIEEFKAPMFFFEDNASDLPV